MALRINAENFEEKVLKADRPVLVDFYSDTCIPCKQMAGILGDIEDENEDAIYIYKVNVNYDKDLAARYKVMSAPTVIAFVNGEEKGRTVGLKEPEEIENPLEDYEEEEDEFEEDNLDNLEFPGDVEIDSEFEEGE